MIIGYGAGGGYDLYGRLAAEFLGRHIPGDPTIVPQNMPGAWQLQGCAISRIRRRRRTAPILGSVAQTIALDTAMAGDPALDATKLPVHRPAAPATVDTGVASLQSGIHSFDDVRKKIRDAVGTSGGASTAVLYPAALNGFAGAKFKLVKGYQGVANVVLALERGEVEVGGAVGLPLLLGKTPRLAQMGGATIIYQAALTRDRLIPDVPDVAGTWTDR